LTLEYSLLDAHPWNHETLDVWKAEPPPAGCVPELWHENLSMAAAEQGGTTNMVLRTFVLRMSQGKAIIWPRQSYVFQDRSTSGPSR